MEFVSNPSLYFAYSDENFKSKFIKSRKSVFIYLTKFCFIVAPTFAPTTGKPSGLPTGQPTSKPTGQPTGQRRVNQAVNRRASPQINPLHLPLASRGRLETVSPEDVIYVRQEPTLII